MNDIILADKPELPTFAIQPAALQVRDQALEAAALVGRVTNAGENQSAVAAQKQLKQVTSTFEKARKALKEPLIDAGRKLDRTVAEAIADVEKELGRVETLIAGFQLSEQRRVREEQEAQQRELQRLENERLAQLKAIADAQAEAERKAGADAAAVATAKRQAELAAEVVNANTANALAAEAKPITATRVSGQVVKEDWEITVTNPWELAKFHPDCVKIEPLMTPIKQALNQGITVKGISARKVIKAGVRATSAATIEV